MFYDAVNSLLDDAEENMHTISLSRVRYDEAELSQKDMDALEEVTKRRILYVATTLLHAMELDDSITQYYADTEDLIGEGHFSGTSNGAYRAQLEKSC